MRVPHCLHATFFNNLKLKLVLSFLLGHGEQNQSQNGKLQSCSLFAKSSWEDAPYPNIRWAHVCGTDEMHRQSAPCVRIHSWQLLMTQGSKHHSL